MKIFFKKIEEIISFADFLIEKNEVNDVFFRGNNRAYYSLLPGLARIKTNDLEQTENSLYYDFVTYGGHLIPQYKNTWEILFLMQHYGIPTRLLDWAESLLTALFFALKDTDPNEDAAIWILDPYGLNIETIDQDVIDYLDVDYPEGYYNDFLDELFPQYGKFPKKIIAIGINPPNSRIVAQRGAFTFHNPGDFVKPLEKLYPKYVKKFVIEKELFEDAKKFLMHSGYNEFSMFPDLNGLARYIKTKEL